MTPIATCPRSRPLSSSERGSHARRSGERSAGEGQDRCACRGGTDGSGAALKQGLAELGLELAHLRADPGLGDVLALRGPGEAPLLGDRDNVGKLVELHKQ